MTRELINRYEIVGIPPQHINQLCPSSIQLKNGEEVPIYSNKTLLQNWPIDDLKLKAAMCANEGAACAAYYLAQLLCLEGELEGQQLGSKLQLVLDGWEEFQRRFGEFSHYAQVDPNVIFVLNFTDIPESAGSMMCKQYWLERQYQDYPIEILNVTQQTVRAELGKALDEYY